MRDAEGRSHQEDDDTVTVNGGMMTGQGHSVAAPLRAASGFKDARRGKTLPGLIAPQGSAGQEADANSSGEQGTSRGEERVADEDAGSRRLKRLRVP